MQAFLKPLKELAEYEEICRILKKNQGILQVSGCMESQKAHLIGGLSAFFPCRLLIGEDEARAKELYEDYRFYDPDVLYYPPKDLLFFQADIHGNLLIRQRMRVIRALLEREEVTVVTTIDGCMDYLLPLRQVAAGLIRLRNDSTLNLTDFSKKLAGAMSGWVR